jgi:hypothetical protein
MKEQVLKIILENGWTDGDQKVAEEIMNLTRDRVRTYFDQADAILLGNFTKPISGKTFDAVQKHIKNLYDETGLKIIITEFYSDYSLGIGMLPVTSSQIKSVGWHFDTLYIEFTKGTVYSYASVPENIFESLKKAESAGKFFGSEIKGKYDFIKTDKVVVNNELK